MRIVTQITLLIIAGLFSLMAMSAKTERFSLLYSGSAAGAFILLLITLSN